MIFCRSSLLPNASIFLLKTPSLLSITEMSADFSCDENRAHSQLPPPAYGKSLHRTHCNKEEFVIQFILCLQCVMTFLQAHPPSFYVEVHTLNQRCWNCCTLRKEGTFQDKAGHCSHVYSLITLWLLHSIYCFKTFWCCKYEPYFMTIQPMASFKTLLHLQDQFI